MQHSILQVVDSNVLPNRPGILPLLAYDLDQDALLSPAVELAVENLFPGAKIQFSVGDRYDDFTTHDLPLDMCVGVIFPCVVVPVLTDRFVWGEALQEVVVVLNKAWFIVIYIDACTDVHGIDQAQSFLDPAFFERGFHVRRNVDVRPACSGFKLELFAIGLHHR